MLLFRDLSVYEFVQLKLKNLGPVLLPKQQSDFNVRDRSELSSKPLPVSMLGTAPALSEFRWESAFKESDGEVREDSVNSPPDI